MTHHGLRPQFRRIRLVHAGVGPFGIRIDAKRMQELATKLHLAGAGMLEMMAQFVKQGRGELGSSGRYPKLDESAGGVIAGPVGQLAHPPDVDGPDAVGSRRKGLYEIAEDRSSQDREIIRRLGGKGDSRTGAGDHDYRHHRKDPAHL